MKMGLKSGAIALLIVSPLLLPSSGLELTATYLSVKLPHPNWDPSAIYDGHDSIYIFGGPEDLILRFHVSTEIVEEVGKLPGPGWYGSVHLDSSGNMFYFGGGQVKDQVYKFELHSQISTTVAKLPYSMYQHGSFKLRNGTVYLMTNELRAFDLRMETITPVGTLKFDTAEAAGVPVQDKVFLFGRAGIGNRFALELSMDTLEMERVGPDTLPSFEYEPTAVTDGERFIYIFGGHKSRHQIRTDGIYQFNCHTYENHFIPVANLPKGEHVWWPEAPRCAFVPGANRIYCFGGQSKDEEGRRNLGTFHNHDEIFYIDLTPLEPPTKPMTPTNKRPNPGPIEIVRTRKKETATTMATTTAIPPSDEFSCRDRPDGEYLHPTDLDLYIECRRGYATIIHCPPQHLHLGPGICEQSENSVHFTSSAVSRIGASYAGIGWIIFVIIGTKIWEFFSLMNVD